MKILEAHGYIPCCTISDTVLCKILEPPLIFYILEKKWEMFIAKCADIHGNIIYKYTKPECARKHVQKLKVMQLKQEG